MGVMFVMTSLKLSLMMLQNELLSVYLLLVLVPAAQRLRLMAQGLVLSTSLMMCWLMVLMLVDLVLAHVVRVLVTQRLGLQVQFHDGLVRVG